MNIFIAICVIFSKSIHIFIDKISKLLLLLKGLFSSKAHGLRCYVSYTATDINPGVATQCNPRFVYCQV